MAVLAAAAAARRSQHRRLDCLDIKNSHRRQQRPTFVIGRNEANKTALTIIYVTSPRVSGSSAVRRGKKQHWRAASQAGDVRY